MFLWFIFNILRNLHFILICDKHRQIFFKNFELIFLCFAWVQGNRHVLFLYLIYVLIDLSCIFNHQYFKRTSFWLCLIIFIKFNQGIFLKLSKAFYIKRYNIIRDILSLSFINLEWLRILDCIPSFPLNIKHIFKYLLFFIFWSSGQINFKW